MWQNNFGCISFTPTRILTVGTGEKNLACLQNYADGEGMWLIFTGDRAQGTKMEYMCIFSYMLFNLAQEMQVYGVFGFVFLFCI